MNRLDEIKEALDTAAHAVEDMKDDHTPDAARVAITLVLDCVALMADQMGVPGAIEPNVEGD